MRLMEIAGSQYMAMNDQERVSTLDSIVIPPFQRQGKAIEPSRTK